jgi:hypothetical protein
LIAVRHCSSVPSPADGLDFDQPDHESSPQSLIRPDTRRGPAERAELSCP